VSEDPLAVRLAEWVVGLDATDVPSRAVEIARLLVLDQLGLQVRGTTLASAQPPRRLVTAMHARPESTIVGGPRTTAPYAAYVNGTLACSSEYDDMHMLASHVGSYVVPTALAFGEMLDSAGHEVLTAIVAGAQTMALLGTTTSLRLVRSGWHGAKVVGTFGATAVAGRLLGLTPAQLTHAFGIAGSDAGGTMEYEHGGGDVKRMHAGSAGRIGAQAALLARDGLTGPATIIDGSRGFLRMFGGTDEQPTEAAWQHFHVLDTMFRMYPAIGSAAPVLDAARALRDEYEFDWREIGEIRLGLPAFAVAHGASVTRPTDAVSAQFSTGFSLALYLTRSDNRLADYLDPALWHDPDVLSLVDRVRPYPVEFPTGWPALSCRLEIVLHDGRVLNHPQRGFRRHPDNAETTDDDFATKFHGNVDGVLPRAVADEVAARVHNLQGHDGVRALMTLVGSAGDQVDSQLGERVLQQ
jgi:2-methylcitrate dehydratase PrpD